jgi:hypothetical protein
LLFDKITGWGERYSTHSFTFTEVKDKICMIDLLQIVDTTAKAASLSDSNHDGKISLIELLQLGGWIMVPLVIFFLGTIYFYI